MAQQVKLSSTSICRLLQCFNNKVENLPHALPSVLEVFCHRLPHHRVMRLRRNALINDFLLMLLCESRLSANETGETTNRGTAVPCWRSNLSHHAHESPRSGLVATALLNHCLAFSILRSAQNNLATVQMIKGSSTDFLSASTERDFRVGRGSAQIARDQRSPDVGHS